MANGAPCERAHLAPLPHPAPPKATPYPVTTPTASAGTLLQRHCHRYHPPPAHWRSHVVWFFSGASLGAFAHVCRAYARQALAQRPALAPGRYRSTFGKCRFFCSLAPLVRSVPHTGTVAFLGLSYIAGMCFLLGSSLMLSVNLGL